MSSYPRPRSTHVPPPKPSAEPSKPFFFFKDPATTEIYTTHNTLSLHDALPISRHEDDRQDVLEEEDQAVAEEEPHADRKSTRLNSSHCALSRMPSSA